MDKNLQTTLLKLLLVCALCIGLITGLVLIARWLMN